MGVADPIFMCELALEMNMPLSELGQRMSNYELNVIWPAYYRNRARVQRAEAEKARKR